MPYYIAPSMILNVISHFQLVEIMSTEFNMQNLFNPDVLIFRHMFIQVQNNYLFCFIISSQVLFP